MYSPIRQLSIYLLLAGVLLAAGCAGRKVSYTVPEGAGEQVVLVQASNFRFEPNEIVTRTGVVLLLKVENTASVDHNLTVEDSKGNHLLERELSSGRTVSVELRLTEPGEYEFYCDKPLHSSFGMTGKFVVH